MATKLELSQVNELKEKGIHIPEMRYLATDKQDVLKTIASDAGFQSPSNGVPAFLSTIWTNKVINQVLKKRQFDLVSEEFQQGDFSTTDIKLPTRSFTGKNAAYGDFSTGGQANNNYNWEDRQVYIMENNITYGDRELESMALAKIDVASDNRESAALAIQIDFNKIGFFGKDGMKITGLINNPENNPAIPSPSNGATVPSTKFADKDPNQIYESVLEMFAELADNNGGNVSENDKMYFLISPKNMVYLNKVTAQFLKSAKSALMENFPNMEIIPASEYSTGICQLVLDNVLGQRVVYNAFTYKFRSHGVLRLRSGYEEKVSAGTAGAIVAYPAGVATMTGI